MGLVVAELWKQLLAERWRAVALSLAAAAICATTVFMDLTQVQSAIDAETRWVAAGKYVVVAQPSTENAKIPASRCLALNENPAITAAGGFTPGTEVQSLQKAPGDPLLIRGAVGPLTTILSGLPQDTGPGVTLLADQAHSLGVPDQSLIRWASSPTRFRATVLSATPRLADPGSWAITQRPPTGTVDECWVEVIPEAVAIAPQLISASLSNETGSVFAQPLIGEDTLRVTPRAAFTSRATRFGWAAAGTSLACLIGGLIWFRRAEIALYRSVGLSRPQVGLIYAGHHLLIALAGLVSGTLIGITAFLMNHHGSLNRLGDAATITTKILLVLTPLAFILTTIIASGSIASYIRDRL